MRSGMLLVGLYLMLFTVIIACISFVVVSSQRQPIRAIMSGASARYVPVTYFRLLCLTSGSVARPYAGILARALSYAAWVPKPASLSYNLSCFSGPS